MLFSLLSYLIKTGHTKGCPLLMIKSNLIGILEEVFILIRRAKLWICLHIYTCNFSKSEKKIFSRRLYLNNFIFEFFDIFNLLFCLLAENNTWILTWGDDLMFRCWQQLLKLDGQNFMQLLIQTQMLNYIHSCISLAARFWFVFSFFKHFLRSCLYSNTSQP